MQYEDGDAYDILNVSLLHNEERENVINCNNTSINDNEARRKKTLQTIAAAVGNALEWYDFGLYGIFSDVIGGVFFPPEKGNADVIKAFTVFGIAFIFRPLGGMAIGYIGDKFGRKKALETSIFLMVISSFCMGILPSFARIGWASTILLVLIRILQGMSVGGQLTSSLLFTVSAYPQSQWGYYGSLVIMWGNIGGILGLFVGFVVRQSMSAEALYNWGWRLPFLFGIVVAFPALYLRYYCEEIEVQHQSHDGGAEDGGEVEAINPVKEAFAVRNRRTLVCCILVSMLFAAGGYLTSVWMPIYMNSILDPPVPYAFGVCLFAELLGFVLVLPLMGILSDHIGRIRCMTIGACALAVLGPIMIWVTAFMGSNNLIIACAAQTTIFIFLSMWVAPMTAWLANTFPEHIRLTAVSIGYNISMSIAGGFSPAIATVMVDQFGASSPGYIYTLVAIFSLIGLYSTPILVDVSEDDAVEVVILEDDAQSLIPGNNSVRQFPELV